MSLFKFGNFEADLDFTDADFLDALDRAYQKIQEDARHLPITGKNSDIVRAQVACYDRFFDGILGAGASDQMFDRISLTQRLDAADLLADFRAEEDRRFTGRMEKYTVKKPVNREQRRNNQNSQKNRR